jgi:hypothetical protein
MKLCSELTAKYDNDTSAPQRSRSSVWTFPASLQMTAVSSSKTGEELLWIDMEVVILSHPSQCWKVLRISHFGLDSERGTVIRCLAQTNSN